MHIHPWKIQRCALTSFVKLLFHGPVARALYSLLTRVFHVSFPLGSLFFQVVYYFKFWTVNMFWGVGMFTLIVWPTFLTLLYLFQ